MIDPLSLAIGALAGAVAGWWMRSRYKPPEPKKPWERKTRKYDATATQFLVVAGNDQHQVRFLSVEGPKALAVCARIVAGRPLTYRSMTGRGKILSRAQFARLREELLRHEFCGRTRAGGLAPTPAGRIMAQSCLARERAAQLHARGGGRK